MTTLQDHSTRTARRPMGSVTGAFSLAAGPVLFAVGALFTHEVWPDDLPNYAAVNEFHDQNVVSTHLVTASIPFLLLAVVAIASVGRGSPRLAGAGLTCSVFGLVAMLGNGVVYSTINAMAGVEDEASLDAVTKNINADFPIVLWTFPLFFVGASLLAAALWRSLAVPRWSAVLVGSGGLIPVAIVGGLPVVGLVIAALQIAGSIPVAKVLLSPQVERSR
jgi:hypothetical protein